MHDVCVPGRKAEGAGVLLVVLAVLAAVAVVAVVVAELMMGRESWKRWINILKTEREREYARDEGHKERTLFLVLAGFYGPPSPRPSRALAPGTSRRKT